MKQQHGARDFFLHLLSTVLLFMVVSSMLTTLFQFINYSVPDIIDPNGATYWNEAIGQQAVRTSLAFLLVSFPIFAWSVWYISALVKKSPELREFRARKWLQYFTIFAAAVLLIGTAVTLVWRFLGGEVTLRFGLKVLSILAVASTVFSYYFVETRDDETKKTHLVRSVLSGVGVGFFVLVTVFGFMLLESPSSQREKRLDEQRQSSLQQIYYSTQSYYATNKKLPEAIVDLQLTTFVTQDPLTQEPFVYTKTGTTTFELCATFAQKADLGSSYYASPVMVNEDWSHPAGAHCFKRTLSPDLLAPGYMGEKVVY